MTNIIEENGKLYEDKGIVGGARLLVEVEPLACFECADAIEEADAVLIEDTGIYCKPCSARIIAKQYDNYTLQFEATDGKRFYLDKERKLFAEKPLTDNKNNMQVFFIEEDASAFLDNLKMLYPDLANYTIRQVGMRGNTLSDTIQTL